MRQFDFPYRGTRKVSEHTLRIFSFRSEKPTPREVETSDLETSDLSRANTPFTNLDITERIETELESEQEEAIVEDTENQRYGEQRHRGHNSRVKFLLT